ncbi:hypothetical protein AURDEDRAFT_165842 [Auricularia subglabra TFB-10046 SS5]|nr:hypothetical protein AURDEDRAFT_165842 [Auricularia subglabra TFB-10046 SS5]
MVNAVEYPVDHDIEQAIHRSAALVMQCADFCALGHIENVRAAARQRFEDALAAPIRARNIGHSIWFKLPRALWPAVWLLLRMTDRFRVSHVCHAWREVALAAPALWTEISVASHFEFANGTDCWMFRTLLDRSGGLPISIRARNCETPPHPDYLRLLGRLLNQNSSRIEELSINGATSSFAVTLLGALRTLPVLRTLTLRIDELHRGTSTPVFEGAHSLLVLESLDISPGLSWGVPGKLPRLRTLSLAVYDPRELFAVMRDCSALQFLRITPRFGPDIAWDDALLAQLRAVPEVCVDAMEDSYAGWFVRAYANAPGTRLRLVYGFRAPEGDAVSVLRNFCGPIHAACTVHTRSVVEFSDQSRAFAVEWPSSRNRSSPLWELLPPASLTSLDVNPGAWLALLSQVSDTSGVRHITLRMKSPGDILRILNSPAGYRPKFVSLAEFTLRGEQPGISVSALSIKALYFVRASLERSAGLPVCVRISNYEDPPHPGYVNQLFRALNNHKSHINDLYISGINSHFVVDLFRELRELPALRTLRARIHWRHPQFPVDLFTHIYDLRALEVLELSRNLSWGVPFPLPSLRSLSMTINNPRELSAALECTPAITSLRVAPNFATDNDWETALLNRISAIPAFIIEPMDREYSRWFV